MACSPHEIDRAGGAVTDKTVSKRILHASIFLKFLAEKCNLIPDLRWLASEEVLAAFLRCLGEDNLKPSTKALYCVSLVSALKV
jgi:hypothetical protein